MAVVSKEGGEAKWLVSARIVVGVEGGSFSIKENSSESRLPPSAPLVISMVAISRERALDNRSRDGAAVPSSS